MSYSRELVGANFSVPETAGICGVETSLAATGSAQNDAAAITCSMTLATGADGTKGVILPLCIMGDEFWVFNNAGSALKVYPDSGAAISIAGTGLGSANTAFSQGANKATVYKRFTTTQWIALTTA